MSVKNQIRLLTKLQAILSEKGELSLKLDEMPQKIQQLDAEKEQFLQELEDHTTQLEELRKKYRDMEMETQLNSDNITKSDARLRIVKTNKEYQAILKEIEEIHKTNSSIEDEMLAYLEEIETVQKTASTRQDDYKKFEGRVKNERDDLEKETQDINLRMDAIAARYEEVLKDVDAGYLNRFNMIFAYKPDHMAVVPAIGEVCMGCNMNIPPQMYNDLQREDKLRMCPHCQRIIYWEDVAVS